jgi:multidrug efflux pump subunit AcrA (membrane-fusion protein)
MKILRNIIIGLLVGGLIVFGLSRAFEPEAEAVEIGDQITTVDLLSPSELEKNVNTLIAYGTAAATQDSDLFFEMSGIVEEVYMWPGAWAEEGMVLAKLESDGMDASIAQAEAAYDAVYWGYKSFVDSVGYYDFASAEASLEMAEIQLEAMLDAKEAAEDAEDEGEAGIEDMITGLLGFSSAPSDAEIEIQELVIDQYNYALKMMEQSPSEASVASQWAYVEQAQAALDSAYSAYNSVYLQAPFSGEITSVDLEVNQMAQAGVGVGKIVNRDNVEVELYLSSEEADSISVGNEVLIENEYEGFVIGISSRIDDYTGKRKVRVQMEDLYDLTTGETVEVEIDQDVENGITLLPITSLLFDDESSYVFFYYDGSVYKRLVDTRDVLGDYVEVMNMPFTSIVEDIAGLKSGQEVSLTL